MIPGNNDSDGGGMGSHGGDGSHNWQWSLERADTYVIRHRRTPSWTRRKINRRVMFP